MDKITVGVLTISDRCSNNEAIDKSGPSLTQMLKNGVVKNCTVVKEGLVADKQEDIEHLLKLWSDQETDLILTTGGTGVDKTDVTPEATRAVLEKTIPGISHLMFRKSFEVTPLAALTRSIAGVRKKSLIVNLPGSVKGSRECLEAIAEVIPHAVDLITGRKKNVERIHASSVAKKSSVVVCSPANRIRISPYPCISVSEAQDIILSRIYLLKNEVKMGYKEALFHVLAKDVPARDNLPPFGASLRDGYAVLSSDKDLFRNVIGSSAAGDPPIVDTVPSGSCVRVSTGGRVPPGTDAVVEVEDTLLQSSSDGKEEDKIEIKKLPVKGQHIRPKGSDFKTGELVLASGTFLDPSAVGLLAAAGATSVTVHRKPTVAVISTGDELVEPTEDIPAGKIRDSNRITLLSLLKEENFEALDIGIARDEPDDLRDALERGFRAADVVVTTGSMSMGERDYMKNVLVADFDAEILFGRVLMKPGKPTCAAVVLFEGKPKFVFCFPGNPASSFVTAHLFLLPALRKISGRERVLPGKVKAVVNESLPLEERPQYVRGILTYTFLGGWFAKITGDQRSSRIGSCVNANCLLVFTENKVETVQPPPVKGNVTEPKPGPEFFQGQNQGSSFAYFHEQTKKLGGFSGVPLFGAVNPGSEKVLGSCGPSSPAQSGIQRIEKASGTAVEALIIGKIYT